MNDKTIIPLMPYQKAWIADNRRLKVWVKAGQIGGSFAAGLRQFLVCLTRPGSTFITLSAGERQSKLFMEKVARHAKAANIASAWALREVAFQCPDLKVDVKQLELRFPNGSVIYGLPANPDTARGYSGNVVLDEFAFHQDAQKIYQALYPRTTRGYSLEIISTPNGPSGIFYDIAKVAGLTGEGFASKQWSGHRTDVFDAVKQGFSLSPALDGELGEQALAAVGEWTMAGFTRRQALGLWQLRAGCLDDAMWQQEFCCAFLQAGSRWIPPSLFDGCVSTAARMGPPRLIEGAGKAYCGWDVARKKDLSILWFDQLVGDAFKTVGVVELKGTLPQQTREAAAYIPLVARWCIDETGMGIGAKEWLEEKAPGQVEGVTFTQQSKETLAVGLKNAMESNRFSVPDSPQVRTSFGMPKREVTSTGAMRFEAGRDEEAGHADHFWAAALARLAGSSAFNYFLDWMKKQTHGQALAEDASRDPTINPIWKKSNPVLDVRA